MIDQQIQGLADVIQAVALLIGEDKVNQLVKQIRFERGMNQLGEALKGGELVPTEIVSEKSIVILAERFKGRPAGQTIGNASQMNIKDRLVGRKAGETVAINKHLAVTITAAWDPAPEAVETPAEATSEG